MQPQDYIQQVENHAAELGLSPLELCRAVGIAESTWRRWRAGNFAPQIRTLDKLLQYKTKRK